MVARRAHPALRHLDALRVELTDLAAVLDRRGQPAAADVALAVSARLTEVAAQIDAEASVQRVAESPARGSHLP
ncbi:MAG TPA: hypothetical protein VEB66_04415 [Opitutaceae bacterium]|nr:hypothetical protein [Opitutaceae bacterium]